MINAINVIKSSGAAPKHPWWRRAVRSLAFVAGIAIAAALGLYAALFLRASDSERFKQTLLNIESGKGFQNESPAFKLRADDAARRSTLDIRPGIYTGTIVADEMTYDAVFRLNGRGDYEYKLSVGNGRLHKTYSVVGSWAVRGEVLHLSYSSGDKFLLAPDVTSGIAPFEREIITQFNSETNAITLVSSAGSQITLTRVKTSE